MTYDPNRHRRRSIRLRGYDYSSPGAYFITICTKNRECLFGDVVNGEMVLNAWGEIVKNEWLRTSQIRPNVLVDEFIVMPNHLHGILVVMDDNRRGVSPYAPTMDVSQYAPTFKSPSKNIGAIVRGFKSATTKQINMHRDTPGAPVWQRNYYEHIIRNGDAMNRIRQYIINNPLKWDLDKNNPAVF